MKKVFVYIIVIGLLNACQSKRIGNPHIEVQTAKGNIEIELYPKQAPKTVAGFLSYIDADYFTDANFYRVLTIQNQPSNAPKTELIQGGIWKTNYKLAVSIPGIPHESTQQTGIKHTDGVISLARSEPGTAGTEFFICIDNQPGLDYGGENVPDRKGYAAFGKVVKGMDVVRKISRMNEKEQYLIPAFPIFNIVRK